MWKKISGVYEGVYGWTLFALRAVTLSAILASSFKVYEHGLILMSLESYLVVDVDLPRHLEVASSPKDTQYGMNTTKK